MEIFDAFCGIGPWQKHDPLLPWKPEDILAQMDHFGIRRALVHSNFARDQGAPGHGNRLLAEACRATDRFVPALSLAPYPYDDAPGVDGLLAEMRGVKAKAVWYGCARSEMFRTWLFGELFDACSAFRIPLLVWREWVTPDDLHRVLAEFPDLRVILAGVRYDEDWWLYRLLRLHDELRITLGHAYVVADNPARFLRHFPATRLLFGSALPQYSPGGLITHLTYADIDPADRDRIFHGNLETLLAEVTL